MLTEARSTPEPAPAAAGAGRRRTPGPVRRKLGAWLSSAGLALGGVLFIPRPLIGVFMWLALALNPPYVVFAFLGLVIGASIKRLFRIGDGLILGGGLKANALLAAVVTGWMTSGLGLAWTPRLAMAGAAAIAATLMTATLMRAFSKSIFPPLLWGYCLVAVMLFSVCPQCTVISANAMQPWPAPGDALSWVESFLRSMGSLMYLPDVRGGLLICVAVLCWSRTMFLNGIVGWLSGVCVALAFQEMHLVYYWRPVSYNYFIAGMALGAVIFLPGRLTLLVAAVGGGAASFFALVLQYTTNWSAIAYLPISSGVAIWVGIGSFTRDRSVGLRNLMSEITPEEKWWWVAYWYKRFGPYFPLFAVPVEGDLKISQGFDGKLSHLGVFCHALDFQRPVASGSIWGARVISPVSGTVERIKNSVPDNPLGVCNYAERWGNHVVIHLDRGGWALLAHLQQGTVSVAPGARVETGCYIGLVGNSGRSPVPHLHLQHQDSPEPGSPTTSFRLANFLSGNQAESASWSWNAAAVPEEGDVVMAAPSNKVVYQALAGIVPGSAVWMVEARGHIPREFRQHPSAWTLRVDIHLDELGQHVFRAGKNGSLVSRLDPDAWRVVELRQVTSPFLKLLALAVPSIPYAARTGMAWSDFPPMMPPGGLFGPLALALAPYFKRQFLAVSCECMPTPAEAGHSFQIDSHVQTRSSSLPLTVTCDFAILRGPVRVQADFQSGTLVYTLLSYEPGDPGEGVLP